MSLVGHSRPLRALSTIPDITENSAQNLDRLRRQGKSTLMRLSVRTSNLVGVPTKSAEAGIKFSAATEKITQPIAIARLLRARCTNPVNLQELQARAPYGDLVALKNFLVALELNEQPNDMGGQHDAWAELTAHDHKRATADHGQASHVDAAVDVPHADASAVAHDRNNWVGTSN